MIDNKIQYIPKNCAIWHLFCMLMILCTKCWRFSQKFLVWWATHCSCYRRSLHRCKTEYFEFFVFGVGSECAVHLCCARWCKVTFGCKFCHAKLFLDFLLPLLLLLMYCTPFYGNKCTRAQKCKVHRIQQPPRMSFESFFYVIILCFTVDLCCMHRRATWNHEMKSNTHNLWKWEWMYIWIALIVINQRNPAKPRRVWVVR